MSTPSQHVPASCQCISNAVHCRVCMYMIRNACPSVSRQKGHAHLCCPHFEILSADAEDLVKRFLVDDARMHAVRLLKGQIESAQVPQQMLQASLLFLDT